MTEVLNNKFNNYNVSLFENNEIKNIDTVTKALPSSSYKLLSLEGGGVKGLAEVEVLIKIEEITGKHIYELFDAITGTSVGALIATLLTIPQQGSTEPMWAHEVAPIFEKMSHDIFPEVSFRKIWTWNGFWSYKYDPEPLKNLIQEHCKDLTLKDTLIPVIIHAYNQSNLQNPIKTFSTMEAKDSDHNNYSLSDILLGATAAPGYFPAVKVQNISGTEDSTIVDGGLFANNPSKLAVKSLEDHNIQNINLVYLSSQEIIDDDYATVCCGGGLIELLKNNVPNAILNATELSDEQAIKNRVDKYTELPIPIPPSNKSLDNAQPENLEKLKMLANNYLKYEGNEDFKKFIDKLIEDYNNTTLKDKIHVNEGEYHSLFKEHYKSSDEGFGEGQDYIDEKQEAIIQKDDVNSIYSDKNHIDEEQEANESTTISVKATEQSDLNNNPIYFNTDDRDEGFDEDHYIDDIIHDVIEEASLPGNDVPLDGIDPVEEAIG